MARENLTWGRRRIQAELRFLGYDVAQPHRREVHVASITAAFADLAHLP